MTLPIDVSALNALLRRYASERATMDEEENRLRTNYGTTIQDLQRQHKNDSGTLSSVMADRGLTHSGINLGENLELQEAYNRGAGNAAQQVNASLAVIARKRLEAEAQAREEQAMLTAGLGVAR